MAKQNNKRDKRRARAREAAARRETHHGERDRHDRLERWLQRGQEELYGGVVSMVNGMGVDAVNGLITPGLAELGPDVDWYAWLDRQATELSAAIDYMIAPEPGFVRCTAYADRLTEVLRSRRASHALALQASLRAGSYGAWQVLDGHVVQLGGDEDGDVRPLDAVLGTAPVGSVAVGFVFSHDESTVIMPLVTLDEEPALFAGWQAPRALSPEARVRAYHRFVIGVLIPAEDASIEDDLDLGPNADAIQEGVLGWTEGLDDPAGFVSGQALALAGERFFEDGDPDEIARFLDHVRDLIRNADATDYVIDGERLPAEVAIAIAAFGNPAPVRTAVEDDNAGRIADPFRAVMDMLGCVAEDLDDLADFVQSFAVQSIPEALNQIYGAGTFSPPAEELEEMRGGLAVGMIAEMLLEDLALLAGPRSDARVFDVSRTLLRLFVPAPISAMPLRQLDVKEATRRKLLKALGEDATLDNLPADYAGLLQVSGIGPATASEVSERLMEFASLYFTSGLGGRHVHEILEGQSAEESQALIDALLAEGVISEETMAQITSTGLIPAEVYEAMDAFFGDLDE